MKIYHYAKQRFDVLKTLREQGSLTKEEIARGTKRAQEFNSPGAYFDHISFTIDPIPSQLMGKLYGKDHGVWFPGNVLFEYVIDVPSLGDGFIYDVVESPNRDKFFEAFEKEHNWTQDDPELLKLYLVELNKKKREWGEIGFGFKRLEKQLKLYQGKIESFILAAAKHPDFDSFKMKYAANVPHLMIYPEGGVVSFESVNQLTIGQPGRKRV